MASEGRMEQVYGDLIGIRSMMDESADFKLMIQSPSIDPAQKGAVFEKVCAQAGADSTVSNFLKVLVENKRLAMLPRMIELYETFYRAEKGLVPCEVTSAKELTSAQKSDVQAAMEKRADKGSTLIMEYKVNPAIMGGLVVKFGEAILDQSVASRLERLQNQLLQPVN